MSAEQKLFEVVRSQDELLEIAKGIFEGTIFTDRHIQGDDNHKSQLLPAIFLPIALGALGNIPLEEKSKIGLVFEYLNKRGPREINGYPTFFSFQLLSIEETGAISEMIRKLNDVGGASPVSASGTSSATPDSHQ